MLPALRAQTLTLKLGFATAGVHANVLAVLHPPCGAQVAPSNTNHLYCCGAMPPTADAVNEIDEPGGCGAARSAASVTLETREDVVGGGGDDGGAAVPLITKAASVDACSASTVLAPLRAHTLTLKLGLLLAGVHTNVLAVLQPVCADHEPPS